MANLVVLGTQWGDEGKGKIIDLLTPSFDMVARYQGGHNAGHTVYVGGEKIILHLLPSGILHPDKMCFIGNGVVVHLPALLKEITELKDFGISIDGRLWISPNAHLILPYHMQQESISEQTSGSLQIGTTCRGIGPAYQDKASRYGIRVGDLRNPTLLQKKCEHMAAEKNILFAHHHKPLIDSNLIFDELMMQAKQILPLIQDVTAALDRGLRAGKKLLIEGAQGALLDIDHGTYPFVTSSNSTSGGACTGLGISPDKIDGVLGVTKAYTTRVGEGPFPTELSGDLGDFLLDRGREYGATTGRPRRCGWFDAVAVSYACRINGVSAIALTKSDILDGMDEIQVCTGYRYKNERLESFPTESWILKDVVPEYKSFKGWKEPVASTAALEDLPQEFLDYITFIEDVLEAEIAVVSTGVERKDTLIVDGVLSPWMRT